MEIHHGILFWGIDVLKLCINQGKAKNIPGEIMEFHFVILLETLQ